MFGFVPWMSPCQSIVTRRWRNTSPPSSRKLYRIGLRGGDSSRSRPGSWRIAPELSSSWQLKNFRDILPCQLFLCDIEDIRILDLSLSRRGSDQLWSSISLNKLNVMKMRFWRYLAVVVPLNSPASTALSAVFAPASTYMCWPSLTPQMAGVTLPEVRVVPVLALVP